MSGYEKLNDTDFKLFAKLLDFARTHALRFEITYHECEDNWDITMDGAGEGEHYFSGKGINSFANAVKYVIENAEEDYKKLI